MGIFMTSHVANADQDFVPVVSPQVMKSRVSKEKAATESLNRDMEKLKKEKRFTLQEVHNKIDQLRKKGRDMYRTHRLPTATGTSLDELNYDIVAAQGAWPNFELYHSLFFANPQWGPGECVDSLTLSLQAAEAASSLSAPSATAPVSATPTTPVRRPPLSRDVNEATDLAIFGPENAPESSIIIDAGSSQAEPASDTVVPSSSLPTTPSTSQSVSASASSSSSPSSTSSLRNIAAKKKPRTDRQSAKAAGVLQSLQGMQEKQQQSQMAHEEEMQRRWLEHERAKEEEMRTLEEELQRRREQHEEAMEQRRLAALQRAQEADQELRQRLHQQATEHAQKLQQDNMKFMAAILAEIRNKD